MAVQAGIRRRGPELVRQKQGQLRRQGDDPPRHGAESPRDLIRRSLPGVGLEEIANRGERNRAPRFETLPPQDKHIAPLRLPGNLSDEPGLADPRLAGNDDRLARFSRHAEPLLRDRPAV